MNLQELLTAYRSTDSVSERSNLEDQIVKLCSNFIAAKEKIARKYGKSAIDDSDYQVGRGYWSLEEDYQVWEHEVTLYYSDTWSYGGYCKIGYDFKVEEVDYFDAEKYEKSLDKANQRKIRAEINDLKAQISKLEKQLHG